MGYLYQIGGKNIAFNISFAEVNIETTDGSDYTITFSDGNTITGTSGENLRYGYSSNLNFIGITALSTNVKSISLIQGVEIDLSVLSSLSGLETFTDQFSNGSRITGDLSDFPAGILRVFVQNSVSIITGNIGTLAGINYLYLVGSQITAMGDIGALAGIDYLRLEGDQITATGDIGALAGIDYLRLEGGQITATGNIASLAGIRTLYLVGGQITATGNIASLAGISTLYLIGDQITATGDIGALAGITYLYLRGSQITATGNIASLAGISTLYLIGSQITATGDIGALAGITNLRLQGAQITATYTTTSWGNAPNDRLQIFTLQTGLTQTEVDNLLIDLSNATSIPSSGSRIITITGNNAAPSGASASAISFLQSKGYTITTN